MCTTARMTYILTYRALREFASGRRSVDPIVAMDQMETIVPHSICSKTHDTMLKALRSFNNRAQKPTLVYETWVHHTYVIGFKSHLTEQSTLRKWYFEAAPERITKRLQEYRAKVYARKANRNWFHLAYQDTLARLAKAQSKLALFA